MNFRLLLGCGALLVLAAAYLLGHEGNTPGTPADATGQQADYGYVALDAQMLQTTEQGKPLYTFSAARIAQDPVSGDVSATTVTVHYVADPARPWVLSAHDGALPAGSDRIRLKGDVQVRGKPPGASVAAQINTQRLDFDTHTQDLTTPLPVTIRWNGQQLDARGLTANLKQDQLRLESEVHGRFSH